jgi:predicted Zn-dependent protease
MNKIKLIIFTSLFLTNFIYEISYAKNLNFQEGEKLFNLKKFKDSKFYFEKDIVFNPKSENSYLYLAKIFKEQEKDILEENNLNTVLLLNPKNEEAIYLLALLHIKKYNFSKVKKLIATIASVCEKMCNTQLELKEKLNVAQKGK